MKCRCYINLKYYAKVIKTGQGTFEDCIPCPIHQPDEYKLRQNEIIHKQMGVDGWQEIYADAPSEEDIRQEMADGDKEKEK